MQTRAFALREGIDADLFGGSVTKPDGTSFNIGVALQNDDDGIIVTDDEALAAALESHPALKSVAVPEGREVEDESSPSLDWTKDQLLSHASNAGVEVASNATKAEILEALQNSDEEGTA